MIVIYDPIPFVKLVLKMSVGNYKPITGISTNAVDVVYKSKFSEGLAPPTNTKAPKGRLSGDGSARARRHGGALAPKYFCALQIFLCSENLC